MKENKGELDKFGDCLLGTKMSLKIEKMLSSNTWSYLIGLNWQPLCL